MFLQNSSEDNMFLTENYSLESNMIMQWELPFHQKYGSQERPRSLHEKIILLSREGSFSYGNRIIYQVSFHHVMESEYVVHDHMDFVKIAASSISEAQSSVKLQPGSSSP